MKRYLIFILLALSCTQSNAQWGRIGWGWFIGYINGNSSGGNVAPSITVQPLSYDTAIGSTIVLSVTAAGTAPLSYQWKKNGVNIDGATSQTYTLTNIHAYDSARYTVVISNSKGSITSNIATLSYRQWSEKMLVSFTKINNCGVYSNSQQDSILSRLKESYIITTFGPSGQNKSTCDFFMYWEVISSYQNSHATSTNTKTGATLRWNFGKGIYSQNNFPAQNSTSVISVTSTDGFTGLTRLDMGVNGITGIVDNVPALAPNVTILNITGSTAAGFRLTGDISKWVFNTNATSINLGDNLFTGDLTNMIIPYHCSTFKVYNSPVTGTTPNTASNYGSPAFMVFDFSGCRFTSIANYNFFDQFNINFSNNFFSTPEITQFITRLNTYLSTHVIDVNFTCNLTGNYNGTILNGESNTDLIGLRSKYTTAGKTLTLSYNASTYVLTPLDSAYVVFTIDDTYSSDSSLTIPLFISNHIPVTCYTVGNNAGIGTGISKRLYPSGLHWLVNTGYVDLQCHTFTHAQLGILTAAQIDSEMVRNTRFFVNNGLAAPLHMAYPNGSSSATARTEVAKYRHTGTIVSPSDHGGLVYKDNDYFNMSRMEIGGLTPANDLQTISNYMDYAILKKAGFVVFFHMTYPHGTDTSGFPSYAVDIDYVNQVIQLAKSKGVRIITMSQLYNKMIAP